MVAPTAPPTNTSAVPNIAPCCQKLTKVGAITNLVKQALPNPFPAPPPHHATVAVSAVGLNYADVFTCLGLYAASPRADFVPGLEFAGTVVALGPAEDEGTKKNTPPAGDTNNTNSSPQFPIGERVMGVVRFGAYASHIHVPLKQLQPLPGAWSFEQGAAFLVQALTAIYGLKSLGDLQPGTCSLLAFLCCFAHSFGMVLYISCPAPLRTVSLRIAYSMSLLRMCHAQQWRRNTICTHVQQLHTTPGARVLIQSAAGGVGLQAVAICLACNAIPVCLVGSESKIPTLTSRFPQLDARTQIFVRPTTGAAFAQQLKEVGYEYDVVFDAVGGPFFQPAYDCLAKGGRYIVYGAASMTPVGDRVSWLRLAWQVCVCKRVCVCRGWGHGFGGVYQNGWQI